MRPLYYNIGSHWIIVSTLAALISIFTLKITGNMVGDKEEKYQKQEKGGIGGTESESQSGSILILSPGSDSKGSSSDFPSKYSLSLSCLM